VKKKDINGHVKKYKARLVADGAMQIKGVDYDKSYSPMVGLNTMRLLLTLGIKRNWYLRQIDVKTAYLNGALEENVYMYIPEGFGKQENKVCHLVKGLYGLCQSGLCWYQELDKRLRELGCKNGNTDKCLYMYSSGKTKIYLMVYVDDIMILGEDEKLVDEIKVKIKSKLEITEEDDIVSFLGIGIQRFGHSTGRLYQQNYMQKILKKYRMENSKPQYTPMAERANFSENCELDDELESPIREVIGMIGYVANNTRPDMAFAVNKLAQHTCKPTRELWTGVKRLLRYMNATKEMGIVINDASEEIHAFCDADWAADSKDRRSFSGFVVFMGDTPIIWKTKKQDCVSMSSQEAEYVALCDCAKEIQALINILEEMGLCQARVQEGIVIQCDNTSAIALAENHVITAKTRHIQTRYHFIKKLVEDGVIRVVYVSSADNIADTLTKPLGRTKFVKFRELLSVDKHQM
jgi:hypothetical protein